MENRINLFLIIMSTHCLSTCLIDNRIGSTGIIATWSVGLYTFHSKPVKSSKVFYSSMNKNDYGISMGRE